MEKEHGNYYIMIRYSLGLCNYTCKLLTANGLGFFSLGFKGFSNAVHMVWGLELRA